MESWDQFIKTIDFQKMDVEKNSSSSDYKEIEKIRAFFNKFAEMLQGKISFLKTFSFKLNQHPNQPYWEEYKPVRLYFYDGDNTQKSGVLQLNLEFVPTGFRFFLRDNSQSVFYHNKFIKENIHSFANKYEYTDWDGGNDFFNKNWIGKKYFKDQLPNEEELLKQIKNLVDFYQKYLEYKIMEKYEKLLLGKSQKQIILQGPPGTGKTRLAKQIANYLVNRTTNTEIDDSCKDRVKLIQFHPSYSYEDFVRGIVARSNNNQIEYIVENKVLASMAKTAYEEYKTAGENAKPFVLIIDEINRANLSSVLGELIYALEYRGEPVESMYCAEEGNTIILPPNLYIIGTMNTADRSIGHIDYAIRRRFTFVDILPDPKLSEITDADVYNKVLSLFIKSPETYDTNKNIERSEHLSPEFNPNSVMIGHSYFIDDEDKSKLKYQIIPLLKEYINDGILLESAREIIESLGKD